MGGYYFISFKKAKEVHSDKTFVKAFIADFVDKKNCHHIICQFNLLFEKLFSGLEKSLLYFEQGGPVFEGALSDVRADYCIKLVEQGVFDFVQGLVGLTENMQTISCDLLGWEPLTKFLLNPAEIDLTIFDGIEFNDNFNLAKNRNMAQYIKSQAQNESHKRSRWIYRTILPSLLGLFKTIGR